MSVRVALALALGIGCLAAPATRADQGDGAQRLEALRSEIEAREARARAFRKEAAGLLGELEAVDRELAELRQSLARLRRRERGAEEELSVARAGLERAGADLEKTRKELDTRLVALYKFTSAGGVQSLYSASDFTRFARRRAGLSRVLESDRALFRAHAAARATLLEQRDARQAALDELSGSRVEIRRREARLRQAGVERRNAVALLRSRSDREDRAAHELGEAASRLETALRRMEASGTRSGPAGQGLARGGVRRPVAGAVRLGFGRVVDPEFGTETRRTGIEIAAERGSGVQAVAAGRVLYAGWFRGYGQMVIVDHGRDHVTVSGYLDTLSVSAGDTVSAGDAIGTVGDTGSLSGPGLYFEIRRAGKPVDPRKWLSGH